MTLHKLLAAAVGAWVVTAAPAQTAAPAADKAAMDRALQQADGPRRRILEAARLQDAKPGPPPVPAAAATAARAREASATELVILGTLQPAVEAVKVPAAQAVEPVPTMAPVKMLPLPTLATLPQAEPDVDPETLAPPRLVTRVDPELPPRLFRRVGQRPEVVVDLTVNVDGSVSRATVRSASTNDASGPVLDAVRQWRYEPQPYPRQHTVRLVLSAPGG